MEYSYAEISDMTRRLRNGLFPGLLTSFHLHETTALALVVLSEEYVGLVLSIDNLAVNSQV